MRCSSVVGCPHGMSAMVMTCGRGGSGARNIGRVLAEVRPILVLGLDCGDRLLPEAVDVRPTLLGDRLRARSSGGEQMLVKQRQQALDGLLQLNAQHRRLEVERRGRFDQWRLFVLRLSLRGAVEDVFDALASAGLLVARVLTDAAAGAAAAVTGRGRQLASGCATGRAGVCRNCCARFGWAGGDDGEATVEGVGVFLGEAGACEDVWAAVPTEGACAERLAFAWCSGRLLCMTYTKN